MTLSNILVFLTFCKYIHGQCIIMPNEVMYQSYKSDCRKMGFPNKLNCPYDYPYLDQELHEIRIIEDVKFHTYKCETTKICCVHAPENMLPNNPIRKQELYKALGRKKDNLTNKECAYLSQLEMHYLNNASSKKNNNSSRLYDEQDYPGIYIVIYILYIGLPIVALCYLCFYN